MESRIESYQSFIPKLKPRSQISKSTKKLKIQNNKIQYQDKKVLPKAKKSSSVIHTVKSGYIKTNTSTLPTSTSASVRSLMPSQDFPIKLSKISRIKTSASRLVQLKSLRRHSRNLTTLEPMTSTQSNFKPLDLGNEVNLKKLPLTDRIMQKRYKIKKTLKIVEKKVNYMEKIRSFTDIIQTSNVNGNESSLNQGTRKVIMLDKLVECNESFGSSLSSTIHEIIPRYK